MKFVKYDELPEFMKNEEVKEYYDILSKKKLSLIAKRVMDLVFSVIALILLSPIMIIIAICIKIDSDGPVFYKQERVTQYNRTFKIYKFRTMIQNADRMGSLITEKNDSRITRIGRIIRKLRIDEIPQLINILLGDMSFVGTRPEVRKYVDRYTDEMKATLLMPAGVTSIASIKYKDEDEVIGYYLKQNELLDDVYINKVLPHKMKFNLQYLNRFNALLDVKICFNTVFAVLRKRNNENVKQEKEEEKININV